MGRKIRYPLRTKWHEKYVVAREDVGTISQHKTIEKAREACIPRAKIFKRRGDGRYLFYERCPREKIIIDSIITILKKQK